MHHSDVIKLVEKYLADPTSVSVEELIIASDAASDAWDAADAAYAAYATADATDDRKQQITTAVEIMEDER